MRCLVPFAGRRLWLLLWAAITLPPSAPSATTEPSVIRIDNVYTSGADGYNTFRIPAIVRTARGTLLAFCEGRRGSSSDSGDIDLLLRRSVNDGATWGPIQVVWDDGSNTCGNPCPIVNARTGQIVLLMTRNEGNTSQKEITAGIAPPRTAWITFSSDDGLSWETPRDISGQTRLPEWRWYATGPGHGIQRGDGRLVAPCDHSTGPEESDMHSHVVYSDDGGDSWALGNPLPAKTDESTVAERQDASLYLNMRNYSDSHRRATAISRDGGRTWIEFREDSSLVEPVCQASVLRLVYGDRRGEDLFVFSNPASIQRENLSVRLSHDGGETWLRVANLWKGPSAYSDLVELGNGRIGCLFEYGGANPYEQIGFCSFSVDDFEEVQGSGP